MKRDFFSFISTLTKRAIQGTKVQRGIVVDIVIVVESIGREMIAGRFLIGAKRFISVKRIWSGRFGLVISRVSLPEVGRKGKICIFMLASE